MKRPQLPSVPCLLAITLTTVSCGAATVSLFGGGDSKKGDDDASSIGVVTFGGTQTSPAEVRFLLIDPESDRVDVSLEFEHPIGSPPQPLSLVGNTRLDGLATSPAGTLHVRNWDFLSDLGTDALTRDVRITAKIVGGLGGVAPGASSSVGTFGNDAPVVTRAELPPGKGEFAGNIDLLLTLTDSSADRVNVEVGYQVVGGAGGPEVARSTSTPSVLPPDPIAFEGVETSVAGEEYTFRWESDFPDQLPGFEGDVEFLVRVTDAAGKSSEVESAPFHVDNNLPPFAILGEAAFVSGVKDLGVIPVPFRVIDEESDSIDFVAQWRSEGQVFPAPGNPSQLLEFPPLTHDPEDLKDLLVNPARAAERRALQIAEEVPAAFTGRIGPSAGAAADRVRLPELAGASSGILALGIAGRTLEILRPTPAPQPVTWNSNPLAGPVSTVLAQDAVTALVLDNGSRGWRLRSIDLESGTVLETLASGAGQPRAMAVDPSGEILFIASSTAIFRIARFSGVELGVIAHGFLSGPRALAPAGSNVVYATGDRKLARFDLEAGIETTVMDGLGEPWGVLLDPLEEGALLVAERSRNRVITIDPDTAQLRIVPARVDPADVGELGSIALPSPRALTLASAGSRLVALCDEGTAVSLRVFGFGSHANLDGDSEGRADPFVSELTDDLGEPEAALTSGADHMLCVTSSSENILSLGGGVSQRRRVVDDTEGTDPPPYDPATQLVRLTEPLDPVPGVGTPWRIRAPVRAGGSPEGRAFVYRWDSSDVPGASKVQVTIRPRDADPGRDAGASGFRTHRSHFVRSGTSFGIDGAKIIAVDVDRDGDEDVLVSGGAGVSVLLQSPDGFEAISIPTGPSRLLAVGDLDRDGDADLVLHQAGSTTIELAFQQPAGTFVGGILLNTGGSAASCTIADLDGDGDNDIAVANIDTDDVAILFQLSRGTFIVPSQTIGVGSEPSSIASADLDADGDLDLVTANSGDGNITLLIQGAPGSFGPTATVATGERPRSLAIADLDGDGDADIAVANAGGNDLAILEQAQPGVFNRRAGSLPTGRGPDSLSADDLDGDGDTDLAVVNTISDDVSLFFQVAPGVFVPAVETLPTGANSNVVENAGLATADLDGDGDVDLVASTGLGPDVALFFNLSGGLFTPGLAPIAAASGPDGITSADLDGDGDQDLAVTLDADNELALFFQAEPGLFARALSQPTGAGPTSVAAGDLDGDGDLDLVVANFDSDDLSLFFQQQPGVFEPAGATLAVGDGPVQVVIADLDGDGDSDLVTADSRGDTLSVYRQSSPGSFTRGPSLSPGGLPRALAVADLDGDGDLDIASANALSDDVRILLQTSPGTFSSGPQLIVDDCDALSAADLDGDGDQDLALVTVMGGKLVIAFQTSPGAFALSTQILDSGGVFPSSLAIADFDGDGAMDIAVSHALSGNVRVFEQVAGGIFSRRGESFLAGELPRLIASDFDGDGDVDLATTNRGSDTVTLFFNGD